MKRVELHELWEVKSAAAELNYQASVLMHKHISDGALKLKFTREVAIHGECVVKDFESGKKTKRDAISELKREKQSLVQQGIEIFTKGLGFAAGVAQFRGGASVCYASSGTLCFIFGAPLMAHGVNNVYENGMYFIDSNKEHIGPFRGVYRNAAEFLGYEEHYGDNAYYGVDLGLSITGLLSRSATLKPINGGSGLPNSKRFKLFRYSAEDYLRGYQATTKVMLGVEAYSDINTLLSFSGSDKELSK